MLLLDLRRIGGEILEMLAYLSLATLLRVIFLNRALLKLSRNILPE